jgi:hypothetical protein
MKIMFAFIFSLLFQNAFAALEYKCSVTAMENDTETKFMTDLIIKDGKAHFQFAHDAEYYLELNFVGDDEKNQVSHFGLNNTGEGFELLVALQMPKKYTVSNDQEPFKAFYIYQLVTELQEDQLFIYGNMNCK